MKSNEWELIEDGGYSSPKSERLKVPGGWLVRNWICQTYDSGSSCVHQIFIADPHHDWSV